MVKSVRLLLRTQPMYNLTVEGAHTFFVSDGQWLVHNCAKKKGRQSGKDRASDTPSWFNKGERLRSGETPSQGAHRILRQRYPGGYPTGPNTEFNKIQKFFSRNR